MVHAHLHASELQRLCTLECRRCRHPDEYAQKQPDEDERTRRYKKASFEMFHRITCISGRFINVERKLCREEVNHSQGP
jgi:hypothetical protein